MPRFTLTDSEKALAGEALFLAAEAQQLAEPSALVAAANTTTAELQALVLTRLQAMRTASQSELDGVDAEGVARKAALTTRIAAIDSLIAKL